MEFLVHGASVLTEFLALTEILVLTELLVLTEFPVLTEFLALTKRRALTWKNIFLTLPDSAAPIRLVPAGYRPRLSEKSSRD